MYPFYYKGPTIIQTQMHTWPYTRLCNTTCSPSRPTISAAVLAHSVTSAHELQHGVKVSADGLKAVAEGP